MKKIISIEGMMCERCKKHVEDALKKLGLDPLVSLENKNAIIEDVSLEDDVLIQTIEDAGYDVKEISYE